MAQHGIHDFLTAKRKAAERLGRHRRQRAAAQHRDRGRRWPNISGCSTPDGHEHSLRGAAPRGAACHALAVAVRAAPGRAGAQRAPPPSTPTSSCICLRTAPENVALQLIDRGVAHEITERRVRLDAERTKAYPGAALRGRRPPHRGHGVSAATASARRRSARSTAGRCGAPMPRARDAAARRAALRTLLAQRRPARSRAASARYRAGADG